MDKPAVGQLPITSTSARLLLLRADLVAGLARRITLGGNVRLAGQASRSIHGILKEEDRMSPSLVPGWFVSPPRLAPGLASGLSNGVLHTDQFGLNEAVRRVLRFLIRIVDTDAGERDAVRRISTVRLMLALDPV